MPQSIQLTVKPSFIEREKTLVINAESLDFDNVSFSKFEIYEVRYGIKAIRGYQFVIGRAYCIDIKSYAGAIIKIRLTSIYGIRREQLGEKYKTILSALFEYYFNDIIHSFIQNFNEKLDFNISGVTFSQEGIKLSKKSGIILWPDVGSKDYVAYYTLFSKTDSKNYRMFYYLSEWNIGVLYSVSRMILKEKNLL